ncbi:MAG: rod shape-determining protein MreC [Betaproteobacteria bacterium]|nr:rod shape-determining protein MreC [Betaproteobacteria bacterium]
MEHQPPPFFHRGPSPLARLAFFSLLSLLLLFGDARYRYLEGIRQGVAVVLYPLQRLATAPSEIYERVSEFFVTQASLTEENARLRQEKLLQSVRGQQLDALAAENARLRKLLETRPRFEGGAVAAEVLYGGRDPFSRKIVLDRGASHGIRAGQVVVDEAGVVGQVTRSYPWISEVTLITEKDHAVPVQMVRSGLRAIVFGSGQDGALELRYMPVNADIQNGDLLVTSGIDGTYPAGLPVARVARIERNAADPFARIFCTPAGGVDRHRQVLILAERPKAPEQPAQPAEPKVRARKGKR